MGERGKCSEDTKTQLILEACLIFDKLSNVTTRDSLTLSVVGDVSVEHLPDPLAELQSIWYCGTKENDTDVIWKHNQNLLPHNPSLRKNKRLVKQERETVIVDLQQLHKINLQTAGGIVPDLSIVDVVNLVKDHPLQVSDDL